jgi:hypothetical protein
LASENEVENAKDEPGNADDEFQNVPNAAIVEWETWASPCERHYKNEQRCPP